MSSTTFEKYGQLASMDLDDSVVSGRYLMHQGAVKDIVEDITAKLKPTTSDRFLEIGCGTGNNIVPLSHHVSEAWGIDHKNTIDRLANNNPEAKLQLLGKNFLDVTIDDTKGLFSKILIYSVIHTLPSRKDVHAFIDKALTFLEPQGLVLIGDIANIDKKSRFSNSHFGKSYLATWRQERQRMSDGRQEEIAHRLLNEVEDLVIFDDEFMLELIAKYRLAGYEAHLLPQPSNLPFGFTRDDLLITKY